MTITPPVPRLSVIVPVHNGGPDFTACLEALTRASSSVVTEVIVVDDGSRDGSAALAEAHGVRVVRHVHQQGPAAARNTGVAHARSALVLFVDADVVVHHDTLSRTIAAFDADATLAGLFGAYDDRPAASNFLSQYKNLLHHYTHQRARAESASFWAGCGAIRRHVFDAVGGFDARAYPTPSIEDIELGQRLARAGYRVRLDAGLQVTHLKRWTIRSLLTTEILQRAYPWSSLIISRGALPDDLNLRHASRWSALLVAVLMMAGPWMFATDRRVAGLAVATVARVAFALALAAVLTLNREFYGFLRRVRGGLFAARAVPLHLLYFLYSSATFAWCWLWEQVRPNRRAVVSVGGVAAATWLWLDLSTGQGADIVRVAMLHALLIVPSGVLIVDALVPSGRALPARVALIGASGYLSAIALALALGTIGALAVYPFVVAMLAGAWAIGAWQRRTPGTPFLPLSATLARYPAAPIVVAIVCLSLVAITPMLTPAQQEGEGTLASYAYIDAYQGVSIVQGLVRDLPAVEDFSFAGVPARVYPDFHHAYLALLSRLGGVAPIDSYMIHGALLLVLLGVPLAYAIGRELAGERLGGYVAATMLVLGVVPHIYDLNRTLAPIETPYMPAFYQTHFYSPRLNQHEGAGGLLIMAAALALLIGERTRDTRSKIGALVLSAVFVAALARTRSQHLLSIGPAFIAVCLGLAVVRRDRRYLAGPAVFAAGIAVLVAEIVAGRYDVSSTSLIIRYGGFGRSLLEGWFLPARLYTMVMGLPDALSPAVAVVLWVGTRLVGMWLALLILVRLWQWRRGRATPTSLEWFCGIGLVGAVSASLLVERPAISIGHQVIQVTHLLAVLLAMAPLTMVVRALADRLPSAALRTGVGMAVLVALTMVAYRAANAAMHDQPRRAYVLTSGDLGAYAWIQTQTPADAVVAAHPEHRVTRSRERVATTNVLTAMTNRRAYFQRSGVSGRRMLSRSRELISLYSATSSEGLCAAVTAMPLVDYLLEYDDTPMVVSQAPCLKDVFAAPGVRVREVVGRRARSTTPETTDP